jgi:two-component system, chemotaxis family, protein-glutamate methylesterase/glutaminase
MTRIRVLVAEDSLVVRRRICEVLSADPEIELAGEAADGREAIELCSALRPDVITMDMIMPVMSGLAATEYIMAHCPTPILIVSSSFNRGELFKTYDALAAGAVDMLEKPTGREPEGVWERRLLAQVKLVARIRVITHLRQRLPQLSRPAQPSTGARDRCGAAEQRATILAIGASTGGPGAVVEVLRGLPPSFHHPILLVIHIAEPFGAAFAQWLDAQTSWPAAYPRDGDAVAAAAGRIVMAPPGEHLVVRNGRLRLTTDPARHSCRPSIDVLFEALAGEYGRSVVAALLTGMGRDGAAGLLAIRNAGGMTIAQDEESSVVYGMPREAARIGAAERVLPLGQIGPALGALTAPKFEVRA